MWNYDLAVAEVMVLIVLFVFFMMQPRLPLRQNKAYTATIILECITLCLDVYGSYLLSVPRNQMSYHCAFFFNMLYFIAYITRSYAFLLCTFNIEKVDRKNYRGMYFTANSIFVFTELVVLINPWFRTIFYIDANGYHKGSLYNIIYIHFFLYAMIAMYALYINRKRVEALEKSIVHTSWFVLIAGDICRVIFPGYLIKNLFCMVAIMILFLNFSNPLFFIDHVTGLFNKNGLVDLLNQWIGRKPYRLVACAIKNEKTVKELYNDRELETVMQKIGKFLQTEFSDSYCFFVEESYFVILGKKKNDVKYICDVIKERFKSPWAGIYNNIYLSPGIVSLDSSFNIKNVNELMQYLRTAVDQVVLMNTPTYMSVDKVTRQVLVKSILDEAVKNEEIQVYFQPIINAETKEVTGVEALARIYDEKLGVLSPAEFIPHAEETGSIHDLGKQILRKCCQFYREYKEKIPLKFINVNLSPIQCMNPNLLEEFLEILNQYDVETDKIHLEITEQTLVNTNIMKQKMELMQQKGFQFSVDDFGNGYANIAYVSKLPIKNIKLDMELIWSHFAKPDILLPSVVHLFHELGYTITAEGVETAEMADGLTQMGCNYLQGYYFSRPLPINEFVQKCLKKDESWR